MWRTFVHAHGSGKDTYIPHDPSYWGHAAPRIDTPCHWASAWDRRKQELSNCSASTWEQQKLKLASSYYYSTEYSHIKFYSCLSVSAHRQLKGLRWLSIFIVSECAQQCSFFCVIFHPLGEKKNTSVRTVIMMFMGQILPDSRHRLL